MIKTTIHWIDARVWLPATAQHVLVVHARGVDRGARYGAVWRHAEYGEEQLHDVTLWADLPIIAERTP
jgi:hypothetical protein